jgi:hypothetical protein
VKVFRFFITILAIALVAVAVYFFFLIEKKSKRLDADKLRGEAIYAEITESNGEDYLKFQNWLLYKENWEKEPKVQAYFFLRELDDTYIPELNSGGWASLAICCALVFLFAMLLLTIAKTKPPAEKAKPAANYREQYRAERPSAEKPRAAEKPAAKKSKSKTEIQDLLRKAAKSAESEPMQAISYLEQTFEESLATKLSIAALLLCGSLRLKNKIGEEQGKEQLRKVISESPNSSEAKKAKMVLDTFQ